MPEKHANRLRSETSPYLLQHAHNPVDWYAWGEEALERARREDKPIFLSIGYSACHWCHVMERESFESDEIARVMNENFINIKVDREERPDLDAIYMNFVQLTTGSGGWPMSVFLTPEGVPFFGGTYFPPEDYSGRPGFKRVLESVAFYYKNRRDELLQNQDEILNNLRRMSQVPESRVALNENILDTAYQSLVQRFDPIYGGFGQAPKFPPSMNLMFLLRYHLRHPGSKALDMAEHSLRKMADGGLYDQLGGGFHRYSVDSYWLVPHFEKMLYDNALLSQAYLEAYQLTRRPRYRRIVEETLRYVLREMVGREGGFHSAQDADSEGEEGKFFVWTRDEIEALLDKDEAATVCRCYDVTASGNFEGKNILRLSVDSEKLAQEFGRSEEEIVQILERAKRKLWQKRAERVRPGTDTKVLTAWNGLMMVSLVNAYAVLRDRDYLEAAEKNADFLLARLQKDGRLLRTYREGQAKLDGYLEDYAHLAQGLAALYEATFEIRWLNEAQRLVEIMLAEFWDEREKGFFFTGAEHERLIVRHKEYYDNATPSGNSVAALVLLKLAHLTGERKYQQHAEQILQRIAQSIVQIPAVFGYQLCALDWYLDSVREFALVAPADEREPFLKTIFERFIPNKVVAGMSPGERSDLPLLAGRESAVQQPAVYICENFTCKQPITEVARLAQQLEQMVPSASSCSPQPHTSIHSPQR